MIYIVDRISIGHSFVGQITQTILTINSTKFVRNHVLDYLNWLWLIPSHRVTTPD
jgi:hypothetical protein